MASSSDIRAGRAFVELYLNKSLLSKGLKAVGSEIKAAGDHIKAVGKSLAMVAGLVTAPILAAAKTWCAAGSEMYRASQRTGMGVQFLSGLKFAANQTGVSFEAMQFSVKRLQNFLGELAEGSSGAADTLHRLGLTGRDLAGLSADQKFEKIAKAVGGVHDPANRTRLALEVFGKSANEILPILENFDVLTQKAARNRRIISPEDAISALKLEIAFTDLLEVGKGFAQAIGTSVAPMLTNLVNTLSEGARAAVDWVQAHRPAIVQATMFAGAALGLGTAIMGVGYAVSFVGGAVLKLRQGLMLAGHALGLLSTGFGIFPILASAGATIVGTVWSIAAGVITTAWSVVAAIPGIITGTWTAGAAVITGMWTAATATWAALTTAAAFVSANAVWLIPVAVGAAIGLAALYISGALGKAYTAVMGTAKDIGGAITSPLKSAASAAVDICANAGRGIASVFSSAAGQIGTVLSGIWADAKIGFANVMNDGKAAFGSISESIQAGDIQGAIKTALAVIKLEWVRVTDWLGGEWLSIKAAFATVMADATEIFYGVYAEIRAKFDYIRNQVEFAVASLELIVSKLTNLNQPTGQNWGRLKKTQSPIDKAEEKVREIAGRGITDATATPQEQAAIDAARRRAADATAAAAADAARRGAQGESPEVKAAREEFDRARGEATAKGFWKNVNDGLKSFYGEGGAPGGGTDFAMNQKYKSSVLSGAAAAMAYMGPGVDPKREEKQIARSAKMQEALQLGIKTGIDKLIGLLTMQ